LARAPWLRTITGPVRLQKGVQRAMLDSCLAAMLAVASMSPAAEAPASSPVTLYLAGDSTLAPKRHEKRPESGWGEYLQAAFRPEALRVVNRARNGRSTRTFLELGEWAALVAVLAPGDVVLLQFGHNDQSVHKPDRYTPLPDYRRNLARFVREVRARGAQPVLLTPVARRHFDAEGRLLPSHGDYPDAVRALAASEQVPLIDMERISSALLQEAGDEGSRPLFLWQAPGQHRNYPDGIQDNTHFSPEGARRMAEAFVAALRASSLSLAEKLR
jgi:lysophospholipase L1-like esterase